MEREPGLVAKNEGVAGGETDRAGRIAALRPADAEQAGVAERQRDDRRGKIPSSRS